MNPLLLLAAGSLLLGAGLFQLKDTSPDPAPDQTHLPALRDLLERVRQAEVSMGAGQQRYLCTQDVEVAQLSEDSQTPRISRNRYETFFVNGEAIARLTEHDGIPLGANEKKAEEARVEYEIDRARRSAPKPLEWKESAGGRMLLRARFRNERRILVNGRPTIALDMSPHSTVSPHDSLDWVAEHVDGELWIDEQDVAIVRLEAMAHGDIVFNSNLLAPKGFQVGCYTARHLEPGVYVPETWCGTVLPSVSIWEKDTVKKWQHRVQQTTNHLEQCRAFHVDARVLPAIDRDATTNQ